MYNFFTWVADRLDDREILSQISASKQFPKLCVIICYDQFRFTV